MIEKESQQEPRFKSRHSRNTVITTSLFAKRQSSLPQLLSMKEAENQSVILSNEKTYLLSQQKREFSEKKIKMPQLRFNSKNIKDASEEYKVRFLQEWDSLQGEMYKQEVKQNVMQHQPKVNINRKSIAYSPYKDLAKKEAQQDSQSSLSSSRDSQLRPKKLPSLDNVHFDAPLSARLTEVQDLQIQNKPFYNTKDKSTYHQRVIHHENEIKAYLTERNEKQKESIRCKLNSFPQKNLSEHVEGYQKTEDDAAKIYIDFQKGFVKLNSLLKTNGEGIVSLEDGIPGYFDLTDGSTAHFCFNNETRKNPKGTIKMQVNRIFGRVLIYISELSRKPSKQTASVIIESNKAKYHQDKSNKLKSDMIFFTVHAQSDSKGTFTVRRHNKNLQLQKSSNAESSDKMALYFSDKKLSMQDIIVDLKQNSHKRSNFLEKLNSAINEHSNMLYNFKNKNFVKVNRDISPLNDKQKQKEDYFNQLKFKHQMAQKKKEINEISYQQMSILKQNRKIIRQNVQREVVEVLKMKFQQKQFLRTWIAIMKINKGLQNLRQRYQKFKNIYIKDILQYFMARKIQREWRRYLMKQNKKVATKISMRNILAGYLRNSMQFQCSVIDRTVQDKAKSIMFSFCLYKLSTLDLCNKMRSYYDICEHVKERFVKVIQRRKHKVRVMNEYWNTIVSTCYLVKMSKNTNIIEKFNGDKFHKIIDDDRQKAIRHYIRGRELAYAQQTIEFFKVLKKVKDAKLRIASKCLFYLQQFQVLKRNEAQELKQLQSMVHHQMMNSINTSGKAAKGGQSKKNLLNTLRRQSILYMHKEVDSSSLFIQQSPSKISELTQNEKSYSISDEESSPKKSAAGRSSKGKGTKTKKKKANISAFDDNLTVPSPESFELQTKNDDLDDIIVQCKVSGLSAPTMEYLPSFDQMILIINEALNATLGINIS